MASKKSTKKAGILEDGYEKIICSACGETLDEIKLPEASQLAAEDKWILTKLQACIKNVTANLEKYEIGIDSADISGIANAVRSVPREYINERGNNVTDECARYLLPLIAGEAEPAYKNGLPDFLVIE